MTIEELYREKKISTRSYFICRANKFETVRELKSYLKENKSFYRLRNCGRKFNEELIQVCMSYFMPEIDSINSENKEEIKENPIKTIISNLNRTQREVINSFIVVDINSLSVRSKNGILYHLNGNLDIENFATKLLLSEKFTVNRIRNVGNRSIPEIENYISNIKTQILNIDFINIELESKNPKQIHNDIVNNLNRTQREVINSFILVNTNSLSVRSKNAISRHLEGNLKIKNFAEKILFSKSFKVRNIKNIGNKYYPELEVYFSIIKDFLIEVSQSNNEKYLISLKNNFLIQRTFSISKIPSEILESESIFLLTDFLLNNNSLFDKTQTIIVKKAFKIFKDQKELTLDDIANEVNLTRERVRQIRKICLEDLFSKLLFIQNFNDDLFQKYNIDINSNQIEINSNVVDIINTTNKTNLSREFITYILFAYLCEDFTLIGNIEDVIQPKYFIARNRHNWTNFYLVKKELITEIDFNALANDIGSRISDRIEESYTFSFKSYLSKFLTNNNIEILDLVFPIAEKIVNDEFELYLDLDENIIFKRNTVKQAYEYSYEALEQLGKPSKVKEIFEKVLEFHPNYNTEEAKIRVSMKRKNGFVPIGRKSVFGLKKWEKEFDNFKGGTIRTISEEFLLNFNEPQHKKEIEKYVKQFRPKTNANSIYNNLYIDESNTFVLYENYYIGLSSKKYSNDFKILSKTASSSKHTWEESLEILKEFINKEKRLPYSSGCPKSEEKLYRWFNIQKRKSYDGKLEKEKEYLISEIDKKYPQINGKRKSNSIEKYTELIAFVKTNSRLPSAKKNGEENLYQFFYKKRKLFDNNKLETEEEIQFIEIAKILQNIKYENKRN